MCQLFGILPSKVVSKILLTVLLLSMAGLYLTWNGPQIKNTQILQSFKESYEPNQEGFWFDLVENQTISILRHLPSSILQSHGRFWFTQTQLIGNESGFRNLENLSEVMQSQLETAMQDLDCSNRLTLNCGHQADCGFGCQLHHRAFCVLVSFTIGVPLIHNLSSWPYKSPWGSKFKTLGSECKENSKTMYLSFNWKEHPTLKFKTLCSQNSCVNNRKVTLQLDQGVLIPKELLDLVKAANHLDPFLWYMGQFIRYALRYNDQTLRLLENYEKNFTFDASHPVVGIQVRRTDKKTEYSQSYHSIDDYMKIVKTKFHNPENGQELKTIYVASEDHTVLKDIRNKYKPPEWKIMGFESNHTMRTQKERSAESELTSVIRDVYFLGRCDFGICGLSSNICRLILEIMATRFHDAKSRVFSMDGKYEWPLLMLRLNVTLVPV